MQPSPANRIIDFKGSALSVMHASLREAEPVRLADALHMMLGGMPDFFSNEPAVLDFAQVGRYPDRVDWAGLVSLLRRYQLQPVGVRNLPEEFHEGARRVGLALLTAEGMSQGARRVVLPEQSAPVPTPEPTPAPAPTAAPEPVRAAPAPSSAQTVFVDRPLRSGQQVYARGADLVIVAAVSHGAEVIADGSIHCYGPLRGRALAGAQGNAQARIFSSDFGPELVSIAGVYRTFENGIPEAYAGRLTQVRADKDSLIIEPISAR